MKQPIFHRALPLVLSMCLLALRCNEPFNPTGPVDQHMFVFSIFSTDRSVQFVRVTAPYMPVGFDPSAYNGDNALTDAAVTLWTPKEYMSDPVHHRSWIELPKPYDLRDTVISKPDTSGQTFLLHVYTLNPFIPGYEKTYTLFVNSPSHGGTWARIVMPGQPALSKPLATNEILLDPLSRRPDQLIRYSVQLSQTAKAYITHLFICYEVLKGSQWVQERSEVPVTSENPDSYSLEYPKYPELTPYISLTPVSITYKTGYLQNIIKELTMVRYLNTRLTYKYMVFQVLQTDANLCGYYKTVAAYQDPRSIRLDEPPFPTLPGGGYGMVGAYTLDSLVFELPSNFNGNR
jgi:hypothetical protein